MNRIVLEWVYNRTGLTGVSSTHQALTHQRASADRLKIFYHAPFPW